MVSDPSVPLQVGQVITFVKWQNSGGSDGVQVGVFQTDNGEKGEFSPSTWGSPRMDFLAPVEGLLRTAQRSCSVCGKPATRYIMGPNAGDWADYFCDDHGEDMWPNPIIERLSAKTALSDGDRIEYKFNNPLNMALSNTIGSVLSRDLVKMTGSMKVTLSVNGNDFLVYYDEQGAIGDSGQPVPGDVTGDYEVVQGNKGVVFRQHVSPHGTSGYGNDMAKGYAAERVGEFIGSQVDFLMKWGTKRKTAAEPPAPWPESACGEQDEDTFCIRDAGHDGDHQFRSRFWIEQKLDEAGMNQMPDQEEAVEEAPPEEQPASEENGEEKGEVPPQFKKSVRKQALELETVKAGRGGSKVHLRYENHPTTLCGQGLSTRGGRASGLYPVTAEVNCAKCLAKKAESTTRPRATVAEIHAPYRMEERGGKWVVVNDKGEVKGTHDTKEQAREQQKALYWAVPGASEMAEEKHKESTQKVAIEHRPDPDSSNKCVCGGQIVYFEHGKGATGEGCEIEGKPWSAWVGATRPPYRPMLTYDEFS